MTTDAMIIQQPRGVARQLVLLFHGLGASEEDLRPLGERLAAEYPEALVASLRAPHPASLGAGYQWFAVEGLDDARRVERVAAEMPLFMAAIRQWQRATGLGPLFLVHGKADDVVHYGFTVEAARHLVALGADVVADVIPWLGHGIDVKVLDLVARRLRTHVPKRHWEAAMRQLESPPDGVTQ